MLPCPSLGGTTAPLPPGSTTYAKGDVVKRLDCILVYGSTTKGDVVKKSDCLLVYGFTTKGGVVEYDIVNSNEIRTSFN